MNHPNSRLPVVNDSQMLFNLFTDSLQKYEKQAGIALWNGLGALLKYGADANTLDNNYWTHLHGASQCGHWNIVGLLLEHGADGDSRDDSNHWQTPLHLAARAGYPEVVQLLVQSSADIHARNNEGRTPLEEASVKGHF